MFETEGVSFGTPDAFSFELFLPWIWKLVQIYRENAIDAGEELLPQGASYSRGYYTKKVN